MTKRILYLILSFFISGLIFFLLSRDCIYMFFRENFLILFKNFIFYSYFSSTLTSIPVLLCLWVFRTRDTLRNLNDNDYYNALNLLSQKENSQAWAFGIRTLISLKEKGLYKKELKTILENISLKKVDLRSINLSGLNLNSSTLEGAILRYTNFTGATLINANLRDAKLKEVKFINADLTGAILMNANFVEKNLKSSATKDKQFVDFTEAILTGVVFKEAEGLDTAKFSNTIYCSETTEFPNGFDPVNYPGLVELKDSDKK